MGMRITIGGQTYTEQDLRDGKHRDNPNLNIASDDDPNVVQTGEGSIRLKDLHGGIVQNFD